MSSLHNSTKLDTIALIWLEGILQRWVPSSIDSLACLDHHCRGHQIQRSISKPILPVGISSDKIFQCDSPAQSIVSSPPKPRPGQFGPRPLGEISDKYPHTMIVLRLQSRCTLSRLNRISIQVSVVFYRNPAATHTCMSISEFYLS